MPCQLFARKQCQFSQVKVLGITSTLLQDTWPGFPSQILRHLMFNQMVTLQKACKIRPF